MPIYDYRCDECMHTYEEMNTIAARKISSCPICGSMCHIKMFKTPMLDPRMGCDPDFPTAYKKWGDNLKKRSTGQMRDSNNTAYGTDNDHEKNAWEMKQKG